MSAVEPDGGPSGFPLFAAEALVSAGKRKNAADGEEPDLCEDAAGISWVGDHLVGFTNDGVSDCLTLPRLRPRAGEESPPPVYGFNARILAQDLGGAFLSELPHFLPDLETEAQTQLLPTVFTAVARDWARRLSGYLARLSARGLIGDLLDLIPEVGRNEYRADWSATFTGAVFTPRTRTLSVVNYGYSGGLVLTSPPQVIRPNTKLVTLWARIRKTGETLESEVALSVDQPAAWQRFTEVDGFALVSDGLSGDDLDTFLSALAHEPCASLSQFRAKLLSCSQAGWDDKAVLFGRFLEDTSHEHADNRADQ